MTGAADDRTLSLVLTCGEERDEGINNDTCWPTVLPRVYVQASLLRNTQKFTMIPPNL